MWMRKAESRKLRALDDASRLSENFHIRTAELPPSCSSLMDVGSQSGGVTSPGLDGRTLSDIIADSDYLIGDEGGSVYLRKIVWFEIDRGTDRLRAERNSQSAAKTAKDPTF
jgi:hypothetical protein